MDDMSQIGNKKKIDEGLEHMRVAEKSLKTSLLKWRPDFEQAADEYNKAATCFRIAKSLEQCRECLMKATEYYKQNRNLFYAAKALDQAVLICKEMGDFRLIPQLAERSANYYQTTNSNECAIAALERAAKIVLEKDNYPEQALPLYQHAADIATIQDNYSLAADHVCKIARIHLKLRQYDLAADNLRRGIGLNEQSNKFNVVGRLVVCLVLVQLAREDVVAAEKAFKEWGSFCEAPEIQTLEMLLQAFDEEDAEAAMRALNSPFIKSLDVEYTILARDMKLPHGITIPAAKGVRENAAPSYVSPKAQTSAAVEAEASKKPSQSAAKEASDEEFEGLC